jgi:hypothetical protein
MCAEPLQPRPQGRILPTRFIDLLSASETTDVCLVESDTLAQDVPYLTLSHCWGGQIQDKLLTSTLAAFRRGLSLSALPRTFQHAVYLTRLLKIRYLWIDALCIIQDSAADWAREASLMGDVYANSLLTISAAASDNSQGGLFYARNPHSVTPCLISLHKTTSSLDDTQYMYVYKEPKEYGHECISNMALGERAWAMQERLLSMRVLHFSRDQVRWECRTLAAS